MFYQRIRDLREDKDISQSNISEKLHITLKTYQRYERGETPITLEVAEQLADFYSVSLDYITGRCKDKQGLSKNNLPSDEAEFLKMFRELSDIRKGEIIGTIKTLYRQQIAESADERGAI